MSQVERRSYERSRICRNSNYLHDIAEVNRAYNDKLVVGVFSDIFSNLFMDCIFRWNYFVRVDIK